MCSDLILKNVVITVGARGSRVKPFHNKKLAHFHKLRDKKELPFHYDSLFLSYPNLDFLAKLHVVQTIRKITKILFYDMFYLYSWPI